MKNIKWVCVLCRRHWDFDDTVDCSRHHENKRTCIQCQGLCYPLCPDPKVHSEALKRITRDRPLTTEEVTKYNKIREQVEEELPDLIERHHDRMASKESEDVWLVLQGFSHEGFSPLGVFSTKAKAIDAATKYIKNDDENFISDKKKKFLKRKLRDYTGLRLITEYNKNRFENNVFLFKMKVDGGNEPLEVLPQKFK